MTDLTQLLLALLGYLGEVRVALTDRPVVATDQGVRHETGAKATWDGRIEGMAVNLGEGPRDWMVTGLVQQNIVHELLHLADLKDDGEYNGSLDPTGGKTNRADPVHSWQQWAMQHPDAAAVQLRTLTPAPTGPVVISIVGTPRVFPGLVTR